MTEEYITERERELLDYIRNQTTDPEDRGTTTSETFTATAGQTVFTLTSVLVKNVADTITVNAITKRKGYDYYVTYGEGSNATTITLLVAASAGNAVVIGYHHGPSIIEREFSRSDAALPRIVMMFLTGSAEPSALGDTMDGSLGSYFNVSYRFEIRSKYATQARELASKIFNLAQKMRHANLYRLVFSQAIDIQNFDYDIEKNAYIWQMTFEIQWEIMFQ